MHEFQNCYARVDPGVTGLGTVRGCQSRALGVAVRCPMIPIHLGWVIAWVVSPTILGWNFAAMVIPVQCANASPTH